MQLRTRRDGPRRVGMVDTGRDALRASHDFCWRHFVRLVMLVLSFLSLLYLLMRLLLRFECMFLAWASGRVTNIFGRPCPLRVGRAAIARAQRFFFVRGFAFWQQEHYLLAWSSAVRMSGLWSVVRVAPRAQQVLSLTRVERCALAGRSPFWCQWCPL